MSSLGSSIFGLSVWLGVMAQAWLGLTFLSSVQLRKSSPLTNHYYTAEKNVEILSKIVQRLCLMASSYTDQNWDMQSHLKNKKELCAAMVIIQTLLI